MIVKLITQFLGNLSKVADTTIPPPIPLPYLRGRDENFE